MVISGTSLPSTSPPKGTTILPQIIAARQDMESSSNEPIMAPGAWTTRRTGYGKQFERANYGTWGVDDTKDCLHAAKFLHGMQEIRPESIGIAGGSYGGYMTICSLSRDPEYLYACGVSKYGDSNLVSSWALCEKRLRLYTEIFLGHPAVNTGFYTNGSPISDVSNVQKPVLVLHGLLDTVVPPESSEEWVEALKRHDKVFEYKTYEDEPHGFLRRENLYDVYERMEQFLDWYLLPR
jgi:dipeptidyl aminopeptidase/acylaminoacyl peptidase